MCAACNRTFRFATNIRPVVAFSPSLEKESNPSTGHWYQPDLAYASRRCAACRFRARVAAVRILKRASV
jgi:hypothetical protein